MDRSSLYVTEAFRVVVIREAEEHDVGAGSERAKSGSHALSFGETGEAPVKVDHAFVAG